MLIFNTDAQNYSEVTLDRWYCTRKRITKNGKIVEGKGYWIAEFKTLISLFDKFNFKEISDDKVGEQVWCADNKTINEFKNYILALIDKENQGIRTGIISPKNWNYKFKPEFSFEVVDMNNNISDVIWS